MRKTLAHLIFALPFAAFGCQDSASTSSPDPDPSTVTTLVDSRQLRRAQTPPPRRRSSAIRWTPPSPPTIRPSLISTPTPTAAGTDRIRILVAWGYLQPHPNATEVVDWSGSISVTNASLRVVRTVRFEDNDSVTEPRTSPSSVSFTSHTRPAADGLLLEIATNATLDPTSAGVTLTFDSAAFQNSIPLTPGERLSEVIPVDNAGHVLAYHVIRPDAAVCHEGFLRGQWNVALNAAGVEVGTLVGVIDNGDGSVRGQLKGVFGQRANGKKVFFAKVIDPSGNFIALIAGMYDDGVFMGRILIGANHIIDGRVHGHYFAGLPPVATGNGDDAGPTTTPPSTVPITANGDAGPSTGTGGDEHGGFIGRWTQKCGEDPLEGSPMTADDEAPGTDSDASN